MSHSRIHSDNPFGRSPLANFGRSSSSGLLSSTITCRHETLKRIGTGIGSGIGISIGVGHSDDMNYICSSCGSRFTIPRQLQSSSMYIDPMYSRPLPSDFKKSLEPRVPDLSFKFDPMLHCGLGGEFKQEKSPLTDIFKDFTSSEKKDYEL